MNFDFLKNVQIDAPEVKTSSRTTATKNPTNGADLRVYKNGGVYPSQEFVDLCDLEYKPQEVIDGNLPITVGNGLDIFSSLSWGQVKGKLPQEVIFLAVVPKAEPKVDLFSSTKYGEDGKPKASVMTQGGKTFGLNFLVPMLTEVYGVSWEEVDYVDLVVDKNVTVPSESGRYALPKIVASGKNKGKETYQMRQNIEVRPIGLFEDMINELEVTAEVVPGTNPFNEPAPTDPAAPAEPKTFEPDGEVQEAAKEATAAPSNPFGVPGLDPVGTASSINDAPDWANGLGVNPDKQ